MLFINFSSPFLSLKDRNDPQKKKNYQIQIQIQIEIPNLLFI